MVHTAVWLPPDIEEACNSIQGAKCPLNGGEEIDYSIKFPLEGILMSVDGTAEMSLRDDHGKNMICVRFAVSLSTKKRQ